jgi:O-antigen biosynthesis protein
MKFLQRRKPRWTIVTAAPKGPAATQWGDTWFAADLAEALNRAGQDATVVSRAGAHSAKRDDDDVVIVLRGLRAVEPRRSSPKQVWMLWVISHPELVSVEEIHQFDAVFAASESWQPTSEVRPLLQATNPRRFHPGARGVSFGEPVLFVGSTRGEYRPMVRWAITQGIDIGVYGVGWNEFIDPTFIRADFLPNEQLPQAYATAGVVLNDHWPLMAEHGFLSNRLFDAVASGASVVSDSARGLSEVFGDAVTVVAEGEDLLAAIQQSSARVTLDHAERIAHEHSFDARAQVLIDEFERLRK